jgi:hypothetical protein
VADCIAADALLDHLGTTEILHGDKGYDSNPVRRKIEGKGAAPNIPPKANRPWKCCFSPFLYRHRNAMNACSAASRTEVDRHTLRPSRPQLPRRRLPCRDPVLLVMSPDPTLGAGVAGGAAARERAEPGVRLAAALRRGRIVGGRSRRGGGAGLGIPGLQHQVRELHRLLGKKTLENEIPCATRSPCHNQKKRLLR